MNILPKKNWHVLKKENIAKVRADIAKAKAIEDVNLRKSDISNQETYLSILRKKSQTVNNKRINHQDSDVALYGSDPLHLGKIDTNEEFEQEKKISQEKLEKNIGLLTYLGQSVIESRDKDELWWTKGGSFTEKETERKKQKLEMQLKKEDPMEMIISCQKVMENKESRIVQHIPKMRKFRKEEFIEKNKKSYKKSHKKSKRKRSSSSSSEEPRRKKHQDRHKSFMDQERESREEVERYRANLLLKKNGQQPLFPIQTRHDRH